MMTRSSTKLSLAGYEVDWMMKTSSPRTFSWISTKISMSAKRCTVALVNSQSMEAAMASASGRLLLPAMSFMDRNPDNGRQAEGGQLLATDSGGVNAADHSMTGT